MAYTKVKLMSAYVCAWTDKYFHQSAYDIPLNDPNKNIIKYLSQFKINNNLKLFRGVNKFNKDTTGIVSWTYNRKVAKKYIKEDGKIIEKEFQPNEILLDTTVLGDEQKKQLGYDYEIDDKEVLILKVK